MARNHPAFWPPWAAALLSAPSWLSRAVISAIERKPSVHRDGMVDGTHKNCRWFPFRLTVDAPWSTRRASKRSSSRCAHSSRAGSSRPSAAGRLSATATECASNQPAHPRRERPTRFRPREGKSPAAKGCSGRAPRLPAANGGARPGTRRSPCPVRAPEARAPGGQGRAWQRLLFPRSRDRVEAARRANNRHSDPSSLPAARAAATRSGLRR